MTSKIYVRTVCPVRYEWVKDLLPRLHQIDAYELSSVAREEVTEEEITKWKHKEDLKRQCGKHNTSISVTCGFLRYVEPVCIVPWCTFWMSRC